MNEHCQDGLISCHARINLLATAECLFFRLSFYPLLAGEKSKFRTTVSWVSKARAAQPCISMLTLDMSFYLRLLL